jgi:hypothetical protein
MRVTTTFAGGEDYGSFGADDAGMESCQSMRSVV